MLCNSAYSNYSIKVEYHADENPLKNSEEINIWWSKVNVSNNQKQIIPYHASLKKMLLSCFFKFLVVFSSF